MVDKLEAALRTEVLQIPTVVLLSHDLIAAFSGVLRVFRSATSKHTPENMPQRVPTSAQQAQDSTTVKFLGAMWPTSYPTRMRGIEGRTPAARPVYVNCRSAAASIRRSSAKPRLHAVRVHAPGPECSSSAYVELYAIKPEERLNGRGRAFGQGVHSNCEGLIVTGVVSASVPKAIFVFFYVLATTSYAGTERFSFPSQISLHEERLRSGLLHPALENMSI